MKPSTKMFLATSGRGNNNDVRNGMDHDDSRGGRSEMSHGGDRGGSNGMTYEGSRYEGGGANRMGYRSPRYDGGQSGDYGESRFRDRRGREHYDNGRFAPRSEYGSGMSYGGKEDGHFVEPDIYRREYKMGFSAGDEDDENLIRIKRMDDDMSETFSKETADKWMTGLKNSDGTTGPHWTIEQIKQVMAQKNVQCDPTELWAAMNAEYSDRSKVNKKYNVNTIDFYLDSAKAFWLEDEDAKEDKLLQYYKNVVRHK